MKRTIQIIALFLFSLVFPHICWGQIVERFVSTKPGSLAKAYKKTAATVTSLEVSGELNGKDFETLFAMTNLTYLDLTNITITENSKFTYMEDNTKHEHTIFYPKEEKLYILCNMPLKTLKLPRNRCVYALSGAQESFELDHLYTSAKIKISDCGKTTFKNLHLVSQNNDDNQEKIQNGRDYLERIMDWEPTYRYNDRYEERIKIDTLFIEDRSQLSLSAVSCVDPEIVKIESTGELAIVSWRRNDSKVDLSNISYIYPYAFYKNNKIEELVAKGSLKEIPECCFGFCNSLSKVEISGVNSIGTEAFSRCKSLSKVEISGVNSIGTAAFSDCDSLIDITLSGVQDIGNHAFFTFKRNYIRNARITLLDPNPCIMGKDNNIFEYGIISIPKGSRPNYAIGEWKNYVYQVEGEKGDYTFVINTPGSLKDSITEEVCQRAKQLTIGGIIYDTDFYRILECKLLNFLDLSKCLIVESPETTKQQYEETKAFAAFFGMFFDLAADVSMNNIYRGKATTTNYTDYIASQTGKTYFDALNELLANMDSIPANMTCIFPKGISKLTHLEELRMPLHLKTIYNLSECTAKKIVLPYAPTKVGNSAFSSSNVKEIVLPSSVLEIGNGAFSGCDLDLLDLSNTEVEELTISLYGSIKVFKLPKKCKIVNKAMGYTDVETGNGANLKIEKAYFYTKEQPGHLYYMKNVEIHIPRGSKPGWSEAIQYANEHKEHNISIIDDL